MPRFYFQEYYSHKFRALVNILRGFNRCFSPLETGRAVLLYDICLNIIFLGMGAMEDLDPSPLW